jgi:hypothetical protein
MPRPLTGVVIIDLTFTEMSLSYIPTNYISQSYSEIPLSDIHKMATNSHNVCYSCLLPFNLFWLSFLISSFRMPNRDFPAHLLLALFYNVSLCELYLMVAWSYLNRKKPTEMRKSLPFWRSSARYMYIAKVVCRLNKNLACLPRLHLTIILLT